MKRKFTQGYNLYVESWLTSNPWYGIIVWIILYTSDYYLTLYCARGFREIGHFQFDGSFELTPQYQNDIDHFRPISRRHLILLVAYSLLIWLVWWVTNTMTSLQWAYPLYLGMFLLIEIAVHLRHLRNVALIHEVKKNNGVEGQITYKRWLSYQISANELHIHATLFLLIALLTYSLFFVGGAIICYATGFKHIRLANKARSNTLHAAKS